MYEFKEFPKMIYKDKNQKIVDSKEEQSEYVEWSEKPIQEAQSEADQKQDAQADEQKASEAKSLEGLTKAELIKMCEELGLESKGLSKSDLIKLLEAK